ncbi:hypothetical protein TWF694_002888 [Orbilia ellipsospora]|uniref:Uncharacterized protein n=1 Tax=Orbilia ellipsospora TaxID=2528407 RepID=A0AAV9X003_9PEZI
MEVHEFSPVADLVVELNNDEPESNRHCFLVSAAALRVASPVWRKILDPDTGFAPLGTIEVNGKQYRKTTVYGTTVETLSIFFDIFHYKTAKTPRKVAFSTLQGIALLADEFDISTALSPWPQFWIESCLEDKNPYSQSSEGTAAEIWLFIGIIFSNAVIVERASRYLLLHLRVATNVESSETQGLTRWIPLLFRTGVVQKKMEGEWYTEIDLNLELIPQTILNFILTERRELLREILEPIKLFARELLTESSGSQKCANVDCFSMALGSLTRSFTTGLLQNLIFMEDWEHPKYSLSEAYSAIRELEMTTFVFRKKRRSVAECRHRQNFPGFRDPLLRNITNPEVLSLTRELDSKWGGPYEFFHRSSISYSNIAKQPDASGEFEVCPLAKEFLDLQKAAKEKYMNIVGYIAPETGS